MLLDPITIGKTYPIEMDVEPGPKETNQDVIDRLTAATSAQLVIFQADSEDTEDKTITLSIAASTRKLTGEIAVSVTGTLTEGTRAFLFQLVQGTERYPLRFIGGPNRVRIVDPGEGIAG